MWTRAALPLMTAGQHLAIIPETVNVTVSPTFQNLPREKHHSSLNADMTHAMGFCLKQWWLDSLGGAVLSIYVILNWSQISAGLQL